MSLRQIREIASLLLNYNFFHTKRNSEKSNFKSEMRCLKEERKRLTIQYLVSVAALLAALFSTVFWSLYLVARS
jgi:hypothetical protein